MTYPGVHAELVDALAAAIRRRRFSYSCEDDLQRALAAALEQDGHQVEREVRLGIRDRLDLLVVDPGADDGGGVALEVKVGGTSRALTRQLRRYVAHDRVRSVVVVTNRARHTVDIPREIAGKPVETVWVAAL